MNMFRLLKAGERPAGWKRVVIVLAAAICGLAALALGTTLILVTWGYVPILGLLPLAVVAVLIAALAWIPD